MKKIVIVDGGPRRDRGGKCGFLDILGNEVIPRQWRNVWEFRGGVAPVRDFNKRVGFINRQGEVIVPCKWKRVNYFENGIVKVSNPKSWFFRTKWVYIDKSGNIVKHR